MLMTQLFLVQAEERTVFGSEVYCFSHILFIIVEVREVLKLPLFRFNLITSILKSHHHSFCFSDALSPSSRC